MADKKSPKIEEIITPPTNGKKKKIIIAAIILAILAMGAGTTFYMLKPFDKHEKKEVHEDISKTPIYLNLESFTVNLLSDNMVFLQIVISLQLKNDKQNELAKAYMPLIRSKLLLLLSGKRPEEVSSVEGKKQLLLEIKQEVNSCLPGEIPSRDIIDAFFTTFIIQ